MAILGGADEATEGQDPSMPRMRDEAPATDVSQGLGPDAAARPRTERPKPFVHPGAMERLIGSAKLYIAAQEEMIAVSELPYPAEDRLERHRLMRDAFFRRTEAMEHLTEAVLDCGVVRWLASLDD